MLRLPLAAALCALPTLAPAEVTPAELWQDWQAGPVEIAATSETTRDGALVLDGVTATLPQGGRMQLGRITLAPAEGAVRVTADDPVRLLAAGGAEGALTAPGAVLTVSGDPGALAYRLSAPELALDWAELPQAALTALHVDFSEAEIALDPVPAGVSVRLDAVRGGVEMTGREAATRLETSQDWTAPALAVEAPFAVLMGLARPAPADRVDLRLETAGTRVAAVAEGPEGRRTLDAESAGTSIEAALAETRLALGQRAQDVRLTATPPGPEAAAITARIEDAALDLDGPAATDGGAAPATVDLQLDGVTLGEATWQRLDPSGLLPRAPASVSAELGLNGRLTGAPAARSGAVPPIALDRLQIDRLALDAVGARADVEGRLDWDGATGRDLLAPEGRLAIELQGAEALIDNLAATGLVSEAQAILAQFGLARFTEPLGSGPGRAAEFAFGPGGTISVNGMPLR